MTVLAGMNLGVNRAHIPVSNAGGGTLAWTAQSLSPELLVVETPSGQTATSGSIPLRIDTSSGPGDYTGQVRIDSGPAGQQIATVSVKTVDTLKGKPSP